MQNENQDAHQGQEHQRQDVENTEVEGHKEEKDPILEKKLISMRWLTMTLNIMKLEKYVEACRMMKEEPDPYILHSACTCILT